jgi:hypothetical protein
MIELTKEQHWALTQNGPQPLRAIDPVTQQEYVLVRAELFERWQALLSGETVYTTAEMLDRVMAEDDKNDPYLAELQKKYGGLPQ